MGTCELESIHDKRQWRTGKPPTPAERHAGIGGHTFPTSEPCNDREEEAEPPTV